MDGGEVGTVIVVRADRSGLPLRASVWKEGSGIRFARRQYLTRSGAALGGVLAAACSLTESLWPGTGSPPRRAPPATLRVLYGQYGPWPGAMYTEIPVVWIRPDGRPETPDAEWFHTTVVTAFMERYPDSTVSFESHHDPLHRALELHRAGTAPDIFQTDDLRNADLIRRRLAYRLDRWIKQLPHSDDFVQPALLAGQTAGVQWGLPLFSLVYTLYFNRHVLQAAGIGQPPPTWGELLDTAFRSTLVADGELVRAGLPAPHSRWFWWLLQLTGVTLYDGGQVAALENEAEAVLALLRDLAAVQPAGVVSLERQSTQKPFLFLLTTVTLTKGRWPMHGCRSCRRRVRSSCYGTVGNPPRRHRERQHHSNKQLCLLTSARRWPPRKWSYAAQISPPRRRLLPGGPRRNPR